MKLTELAKKFLEECYLQSEDGNFCTETPYAYDTIIDKDVVSECLEGLNGEYLLQNFQDKCEEILCGQIFAEEDRFCERFMDWLPSHSPICFSAEDAIDTIRDMLCISLPWDWLLRQEYRVNIVVDTGDGDYDFSLNTEHYISYCGKKDALDEKASLVWLAVQQGFSHEELNAELCKGDAYPANGFMESVRQELANCSSPMTALTFFVTMTLEELLEVNKKKKTGEGNVTLKPEVACGLVDFWYGAGSCLDIQLKKEVSIPAKFIHSALPDGCEGYSVAEIYGLCGSFWKAYK